MTLVIHNGTQYNTDRLPKGVDLKECVPLDEWYAKHAKGRSKSGAEKAAANAAAREAAERAAADRAADQAEYVEKKTSGRRAASPKSST